MENPKAKSDPRTLRTKLYLRCALVKLMDTKSVRDISIKDLIETAQITRSTFYLHYLDKADFIDKIIDDVLTEYEWKVERFDELPYRESIFQRAKAFFTYIAENAGLYRAMLGKNGVPAFRIRMQQIGLNYFYSRYLPAVLENNTLDKNGHDVHIDFKILDNYIVSAKMGIVDYWLNSGMKLSPDYLAQVTSEYVYTLVVKSHNIIKPK